jgi:putative transposase
MGIFEALMKIVVKVSDVVAVARQFRASPAVAMQELVRQVRDVVGNTLEKVMEAELELHLGEEADPSNKRNGYRQRSFALKGIGGLTVRVPRDRNGTFVSQVVPRQAALR